MEFPALMLVDYVRVYQRQGQTNIGCNPARYPTSDYIARHPEAYNSEFERIVWVVYDTDLLNRPQSDILVRGQAWHWVGRGVPMAEKPISKYFINCMMSLHAHSLSARWVLTTAHTDTLCFSFFSIAPHSF